MATTAFAVRRARRPIWQLERATVAATLLAILAGWLCCTELDYGENPFVRLPYSARGSAACLPDKPVIMISVDAQARIYLSHDDRRIQTEAIRQAAAGYGVPLTNRQLAALAQLPYVGLDLQQLPAYLNLPPHQQRQIQLPGIPNDTLRPQLAECVMLARQLTIQRADTAPYIALRMDARLPAAQVRSVLRALEQRGLHRFYLMRVGPG